MPYINLNGRLTEVTQEQFDVYNLGQGINPASGGIVTDLNNTQQILTPNTTNNTPGQPLPVVAQRVSLNTPAVNQTTSVQTPQGNLLFPDQATYTAWSNDPNSVSFSTTPGGTSVGIIPDTTATSNDPAVQAEVARIQEATGQRPTNSTPQTMDEQLAAVNAEQVRLGGPDATAASNDPAVQAEVARIQEATGQQSQNTSTAVDNGADPYVSNGQSTITPAPQDDGADPYVSNGQTTITPVPQDDGADPYVSNGQSTIPQINPITSAQAALQNAGTNIQNLVAQARKQQELRNQRQDKAQSTDWRVRLRLAPNSNYLYNSNQPGLLAPLSSAKGTDGVIFPYTPAIDTAYKANYDTYDLTHSNFRGYFYKNSYVDAINVRAQFTAQDTNEADYLMAVIHFFRSVTKMFYGQDALNGTPPPLVYLSGYGVGQFNEHPCLVGQFNYSLPPDVDYIRAGTTLSNGTNLLPNRTRQPNPRNPVSYSITRLLNNGLTLGALDVRPSEINSLDLNSVSYVPTKMEISITLLPIQTRSQVSKQFSLQGFSNGNLLKAGYW